MLLTSYTIIHTIILHRAEQKATLCKLPISSINKHYSYRVICYRSRLLLFLFLSAIDDVEFQKPAY